MGNGTTAGAQGWTPVPPVSGSRRGRGHSQDGAGAEPSCREPERLAVAGTCTCLRASEPRAARLLRAISIFLLVVFIGVASFVVSQYMVWRDARQLAHDLDSEKQQNLDAAWQQYTKLASRSHVPFILWSAESAHAQRADEQCRSHHCEI